MPYKVKLTELSYDMKRLGIPGYDSVNVKNSIRNMEKVVHALITNGEIQRYSNPVVKSIIKATVNCIFKPLWKFSTPQQDIINNAIFKEGREFFKIRHTYNYCFKKFKHHELPKSSWDDSYEIAHDENLLDLVADHLYVIYKLEKSILKNGLNASKPLLIGYYVTPTYSTIALNGGHHRIQAVRNLVKKRKLSRDTEIPCVVMKKTT